MVKPMNLSPQVLRRLVGIALLLMTGGLQAQNPSPAAVPSTNAPAAMPSAVPAIVPTADVPETEVSDVDISNTDSATDNSDIAPFSLSHESPAEKLPGIALTPELFYKFLLAEIAAQRGAVPPAVATYLELSRRTRDPRLARRAVELSLGSGDLGLAFESVSVWNKLAPDSEIAQQTQLALSATIGREEILLPYLKSRLKRSSYAADDINFAARTLARMPDKKRALTLLDQVLAEAPASPARHLALAQSAAAAGDNARAHQEAQAAATFAPDSEVAALAVFQSSDKEQFGAATAQLKAFVEAHPQASVAPLALARVYAQAHDYPRAQAVLNTFLQAQAPLGTLGENQVVVTDTTSANEALRVLSPHAARLDALFMLALVHYQAGQLAETEHTLTEYLTAYQTLENDTTLPIRNPDTAYLMMAQVAEDRQQPDQAIVWLDRIEEGEQRFLAQLRKAMLLARQGNVGQAQVVLAHLTPHTAAETLQLLLGRSQVLREAGRYQDAYDLLTQITLDQSPQVDILYERAMLAERLERLDLMQQLLEQVIALQPEHAHAYNALGYSWADRNVRLPEAQALIEKAHALAPEDAAILDSMGWVAFRQGRLQDALAYLKQAAVSRNDVEILVHLGEVLWVSGQHNEAQAQWRTARQREPNNALLQSTLKRLHPAS